MYLTSHEHRYIFEWYLPCGVSFRRESSRTKSSKETSRTLLTKDTGRISRFISVQEARIVHFHKTLSSKRGGPRVVEQPPQLSIFGSTTNGSSQPSMCLNPHDAARVQPIANELGRTTSRATSGVTSTQDDSLDIAIEPDIAIELEEKVRQISYKRSIPSHDVSYRLAMEYKEKFDALNEKLENLSAIVHGRAQCVGDAQNVPPASPNNQRSSTSLSHLMRIQVVASGYVNETDSVKVKDEELGLGLCEIIIQSQMRKDVSLAKPYDHIQTIKDSLGAPVTWPLTLVALDDNGDRCIN
ncbi:hypothetical protein Pfo_029182 [Paulownia fortunei]|nr:hypothetical protein Pfo_029182 [Paulownia fortunei]